MNPITSPVRGVIRRIGLRLLSTVLLAGCEFSAAAQTYTWSTLTPSAGSLPVLTVPAGVALDATGDLFVDEWYNWTLYRLTPGDVALRASWSVPLSAGLPTGLTVGRDGAVYVICNFSVLKFSADGTMTTLARLWNDTGRIYEYPQGIAVDDDGLVYVTDSERHNIQTISPDGTVAVLAGSAGRFVAPAGLAVDPMRHVYVSDLAAGTITKITPAGVAFVLAGKAGETGSTDGPGQLARFGFPLGLALDRAGNLYVADTDWESVAPGISTIRRISPAGIVTTIGGLAGSPGVANGAGNAARFLIPLSVAVDAAGNIYVGEEGSHSIRKGTPDPAPDPDALVVRLPAGHQEAEPGQTATFSAAASGRGPYAYQWLFNDRPLVGATHASHVTAPVSSASAGLYSVRVTDSRSTVTSAATILGLHLPGRLTGSASEVNANIVQASGQVCDQVLLTGPAAAVRADSGQVVRISFIDLSDNIVQVEFSGAGTLALTLENPSGPASPANYNQAVGYMRGHARLVVNGANESTNLSVFSVGRITAFNQGLFRDAVAYDGHADIASVAIASANGRFGGLRLANATCFAHDGLTGIYAPEVAFEGPVYLGDLTAFDTARPVLVLGSADDVRITGGDLLQDNAQPVEIRGISRLRFVAGQTSHGVPLPAQPNRARLEQGGVDLTVRVVAGP